MSLFCRVANHMPKKTLGRIVLLVILWGGVMAGGVHAEEDEDEGEGEWQDHENYIVIDEDTTWSGVLTRAELPKPVVVVRDAVLTIEPGTRVEVNTITVYSGRIVALGTAQNQIVFTKQAPDFSWMTSDFEQYDRECFLSSYASGTIEFMDWETRAEEVPSLFRFVTFDQMGQSVHNDGENCPASIGQSDDALRRFFFPTAEAAQPTAFDSPALRFATGKLRMENVSFKESSFIDIETSLYFNDEWESYDVLQVVDTNFFGDAVHTALASTIVHDGDVERDFSDRVLMENNWYGAASGPTTESNPGGNGVRLSGTFKLSGFSATEFSYGCTANCYSNILFLPGLQASRLYRPVSGDTDPLWEPRSNSEVAELFLDSAGNSLYDDVYTRDVIDNAYLPIKGNIYQSLLIDLDSWKNTEGLIADYAVTPYDWRLTLDDILKSGKKTGDRISYLDDTDAPYIITELRRLAESSRTGKVTLIAHSNGGLLAKALTDKLGAEAGELIDQMVLVSVPQSGTPQAVGAILNGFDQGLPVNWFPFAMSPRTARMMAENMASGYNLLPSEAYFEGEGSGVETPVVTFENGALTDAFMTKYGDTIDSHAELREFLVDSDLKVPADSTNIENPSRVNAGLLLYANNVKQVLDDWTPPARVKIHQIAGFGEETLSTVRYWTGVQCIAPVGQLCLEYAPKIQYSPKAVIDGDGTVVAPSALAMSKSDNVTRWWVDLFRYDDDDHLERRHADILEVPQLRSFIKENILTQTSITYPQYIVDQKPVIEVNFSKRLNYYLHSPLALSARNSTGQVISANEDTYPGATYRRFGEVQFLSVPAGSAPTLVLDGLADGSFTLEVELAEGETVTEKTTFAGIMTSPDTEVTMAFPLGTIAQAGPLVVDYDGDGMTDVSLEPVLGETVMPDNPDTVVPTTTATFLGTSGTAGWYTSDVTVTLNATDNALGSGIEKTEYSLDESATWRTYSTDTPLVIAQEGVRTLQYFSTDKAGNKEAVQTTTLQIDKTAPEGKIVFDPSMQKISITGADNLGGIVTAITIDDKREIVAGSIRMKNIKPWFDRWLKKHKKNLPDMLATLTDEAGHTTSITFEKTKDRKGYVFVRVRSLGYDDSEVAQANALAQYKWRVDRKNQYQALASHLKAGANRIESRYIQKKNETWIMERPEELGDDDRDDEGAGRLVVQKLPGMVVPFMETQRGKVSIKY